MVAITALAHPACPLPLAPSMHPRRARLCRYDSAADIWSFGITLMELASGMPPLARCHPMRVLSDTMNLPPPSLPPHVAARFSKVPALLRLHAGFDARAAVRAWDERAGCRCRPQARELRRQTACAA